MIYYPTPQKNSNHITHTSIEIGLQVISLEFFFDISEKDILKDADMVICK